MKDAYKRRREAERELTKALPGIDPNLIVLPTHEERLVNTYGGVYSVAVQGNNLIAMSNERWGVALYNLDIEKVSDQQSHPETISSTSEMSDDDIVVSKERSPTWYKVPVSVDNRVTFIVKDVIASSEGNGSVSTWCARTGERLEKVKLRDVQFNLSSCKISETEFVLGSREGHLCFFTHSDGYHLKEAKRIWKAHRKDITTVGVCNGKLVSGSSDATARLWDSTIKQRLATLNHNLSVYTSAISDRYILTGSCGTTGKGEIRMFLNIDGYPLNKVFCAMHVGVPRILEDDIVIYWIYGQEFRRHFLVFFEPESENVIAQLKVGCRFINEYEFMDDGRLVTGGDGCSCTGAISTLPKNLRKLIKPSNVDTSFRVEKRRMCTIM